VGVFLLVEVQTRAPFTKETQTKPFGGFTNGVSLYRELGSLSLSLCKLLFFSEIKKEKKFFYILRHIQNV
jgi:hypothetical protein